MRHPVILVMGVAGAGKTTIGKALAQDIGAAFVDADDYHSKENIAHMAAGKSLSDDMRWPWLDIVGEETKSAASKQKTVLACSALKRIYRDYLRASFTFTLVYPQVPLPIVQKRLARFGRRGIPMRFLRSQYDALSEPTKDEAPIIVSGDQPIEAIIAETKAQLR